MDGQNIIRKLIFMVFFGIGAAAVAGSILCDDLTAYFRNKLLLDDAQEAITQLKSLNSEYDELLSQLDADPNLFERIAPAALGIEHQEQNTVYPSATLEQLAIARRALALNSKFKIQDSKLPTNSVPAWLSRCSEPRRRMALFFVGAGLILTSFICFGFPKKLKT